MTLIVGLLRQIVSRLFPSPPALPGTGQRIEAREQEAARRRLLDQARGTEQQPSTVEDRSLDYHPAPQSAEGGK
ncbi:hypothetical protein [Micromonospora purpureochromogenes]|uniref:Sec-independent protein translocase protein TatA n=1 Tax=Micromonospora purpureochromogenes TaxID=47872 RepID=A0ABX2RSJ2_9ACTN|nr:hypothetical protein [Micromonospora purpureochromogenes]NYF58194.1 hypothetical protein [Micromonospora purpureochromogenes]